MDAMEGPTAFARMMALGERLIEAQRLEESLVKICSKRSTTKDLEAWKESRRWVEAFAYEYAEAVREWREGIEAQLAAEVKGPKRTKLLQALTPLQKPV
jgi:hypothetical protein